MLNSRLEYQKTENTLFKIDTLFITKMTENPYTLWGHTFLYNPHKEVTPRPESMSSMISNSAAFYSPIV